MLRATGHARMVTGLLDQSSGGKSGKESTPEVHIVTITDLVVGGYVLGDGLFGASALAS